MMSQHKEMVLEEGHAGRAQQLADPRVADPGIRKLFTRPLSLECAFFGWLSLC